MSKNEETFEVGADGLDTDREQMIGQHIGYRYDVNLVPDLKFITPFLQKYIEKMGWKDLNWLEDIHMGMRAIKLLFLIEILMVGSLFRTI